MSKNSCLSDQCAIDVMGKLPPWRSARYVKELELYKDCGRSATSVMVQDRLPPSVGRKRAVLCAPQREPERVYTPFHASNVKDGEAGKIAMFATKE